MHLGKVFKSSRPEVFFKKDVLKICRTPFPKNTSGRLLLKSYLPWKRNLQKPCNLSILRIVEYVLSYFFRWLKIFIIQFSQLAFSCSRLTIEALEKGENMFKVDNKNIRATSVTLLWCFYCQLWTYFTPFSSAFIIDFEQVNVSWENLATLFKQEFWRQGF